jgi:Transposase DDE domain
MESLVELFVSVDDFCQAFLPQLEKYLLQSGQRQRRRERSLTTSEVMTILIHFHQSHYRNFKAYYCEHVLRHLRSEFPGLVSYTRFVDFIPSALLPLCAYFRSACLGDCTGVSFIDSTSIDVCLNQRIASHKVFAGLAGRGKTSTGWFYGFKLHLVINDRGELLNVRVTPGNVDDRKPVHELAKKLFGKLFGDKGYISQPLVELLRQTIGVQMITKLKSNSKNRLPMTLMDRILLRRRAIVESVIDQLKNISQIEHSRHRSVVNFMVNLLCGLIAYAHQPKKPSLGRDTLACLSA